MDRGATLKDLTDRIEDDTDRIKVSLAAAGARPHQGLQHTVESLRSSVREAQRKLEIVRQMPYVIESVLATSGKAMLRNKVMDWAFVGLPSEFLKFHRPNTMFSVPLVQMPRMYDLRLTFHPYSEDWELTEFGALEKDGYYMKRGRTTDVTAGICNGALACCKWKPEDCVRYDHNGDRYQSLEITTEEFVILSKMNRHRDVRQISFAEQGDSGSFVIDRRGRVCGLLYAGASGYYGPPGEEQMYAGVGLAMNMPDVHHSIKLKFGSSASLILPEPE